MINRLPSSLKKSPLAAGIAAASTSAVAITQQLGQTDMTAGAVAGAAAGGVITLASQVLTSIWANVLVKDKEPEVPTEQHFRSWMELAASAAGRVITETPGNSERHEALSQAIKDCWTQYLETRDFRDDVEALSLEHCQPLIEAAVSPDGQPVSILEEDTWFVLLNAANATGQCEMQERKRREIAKRLHELHPQAIIRELTETTEGEPQYKRLLLSITSETLRWVKDIPNLVKDHDSRMQQHVEVAEDQYQNINENLVEHTQLLTLLLTLVAQLLNQRQPPPDSPPTVGPAEPDAPQPTTPTVGQASPDATTSANAASGTARPTSSSKPYLSNLHRQMFVNRFFVERKSLLTKLHKSLQQDKKTAVTQAAAIHGLGGIGKTQLALEYAKRYQDQYDLVWWLKAEDESTLIVDLAALAVPLGLLDTITQNPDQKAIASAVVDTLSSGRWNGQWLLIFDNAESRDALEPHLPSGDGHTIITSRDPDWHGLAKPLPVKLMTKTEARKLIKERSGQNDTKAADEIADRLGYLPLALEVAAAYCSATKLPLSEYLGRLETTGVELLDKRLIKAYGKRVTEAWALSFEQAIAECEHAGPLLAILAHVAPDDFPEEIVTDTLGGQENLDDAIAALLKYSLISRRQPQNSPYTSYLSIHRLVQDVIRNMLAPPQGRESVSANTTPKSEQCPPEKDSQLFPLNAEVAVELALKVVNGALPTESYDVRAWPVMDVLLPHANVIVQLASDDKDRGESNILTRVYAILGQYYRGRANYVAAEPLMRRALSIGEQSYGKKHPTMASRLGNLAALLLTTNRLSEAEPLMRRALSIAEQSYGKEHAKVAIRLNNLAQLLVATNHPIEAEPLMRRGLAIEKQSKGEDHPHFAIQLNNLAQLLQATSRPSEAEPLMRRALSIDEQFYGEHHPTVATRLNNLAMLLQDTNRADEGEPLMRRALTIFYTSLGEQHPDTQGVAQNYRLLMQGMGLSEAEITERVRTAMK